MPSVSVVIPTYNREKLIGKTLESVLEQTYSDFEIVVVDDYSKDDTRSVVEALGDPRIRYIRHEVNKGAPAARNTGLKIAEGELIAFLDSDDLWLPTKLEAQVERMLTSELEPVMIYTGTAYINMSGETRYIHVPTKRGNIFSDLLLENVVGGTSTGLIKKGCLERLGGFDETLPSRQDYDLWLRLARDFAIDFVAEPLTQHVEHDIRITSNLKARIEGRNAVFNKIRDELKVEQSNLARYLYETGVLYFEDGDVKAGRAFMYKAMQAGRLPKAPVLLLLSYVNPHATKRARELSLKSLKRWMQTLYKS